MINLKDKQYEEVEIISIVDNGIQPTFDVVVKNNHHYLTKDNIVTHNTSILANIISGGIEPVFMTEYIRTAIVSVVPEHIKNKTPKYWEGEYVETSMFKWVKEGSDDILKGTDEFGVVYKIDKNRGLTKEVLCQDAGVRYLKENNLWEDNAEWCKTTTSLTVEDHINDLKGFAKYVDSAISKTISIPNDYPFEDFKNVYLDAYKTKYIKGITTYRSGTMISVLAAKDENLCDEEEIIIEDIKMPESSPSLTKTLKAEGKKWYLTVVLDTENKRPFALFVQTNSSEKNVPTNDAVDRLINLAIVKGIPEKYITDIKNKITHDSNVAKVARVISLCLRHGVRIKNIVATLDEVDTIVGSFIFQVKKFLATYIKDGTKATGQTCTNCGSTDMRYESGCTVCSSCGNSKCS